VALSAKLAKHARRAGLSLGPEVSSRLVAYFQLLQKWNEKISLTSLPVRDAGDEALDRLLIEPLIASQYLPNGNSRIVDIGSGGGSPAIPLKIVLPGSGLQMVESKNRKAAFLREAIRQLTLTDTTVFAGRFEELLAKPALHEAADAVTIRAVKTDERLLMSLQALLRPGGFLCLFHSGSLGQSDTIHPFSVRGRHALLPHLNSSLTVFEKR